MYNQQREALLVRRSGLFDPAWYLKQYPDVAAQKIDPLLHYLRHGAHEGRDPGPIFSTWGYVERYPEAGAEGVNPLVYFLTCGRQKGQLAVRKDYAYWIEQHDLLSEGDRIVFSHAIKKLSVKPVISIVMPVYNTNPVHLARAIESVVAQSYPYWELCISDDASSIPEVREVLDGFAQKDARIKVTYRVENGHISANSNSALQLATGDYVGFLDHDDELAEQALFWCAQEIQSHPEAEIIYSDEDKLDAQGRREAPMFKPDWNPALIMAQNYVCHWTIYRRRLVERLGGLRVGFEGGQDLDLLLRCADLLHPKQIRHIPRILYHWRADVGSTASEVGLAAKPYAWKSGAEAIQQHLDRQRIKATVAPVQNQYYQVEYALPLPAPEVDVIIPTALKLDFVPRCISSILDNSTYPSARFVIVTSYDQLQGCQNKSFLEKIQTSRRVSLLVHNEQSFNYARINNLAVRQSNSPIICFLNDDVEVITHDWLEKLVARVLLDKVAAVGPMLYFPSGRIQHAGVILGIGGVAGHQFLDMPRGSPGYYGRAMLEQDLSCVTAACMVVRRNVFQQIGGFDERFAVAFNDVDLCLRIRQEGWRIIWTPAAEMCHNQSASLGRHDAPERVQLFQEEVQLMRSMWANALDADPFFNPNLSLARPDYKLAFPPRLAKLPFPKEESQDPQFAD